MPKLYKIELEGSIVEVCDRCIHYGKLIQEPSPPKQVTKPVRKREEIEEEYVLVDGYGKLIKEAREKLGLTRKEFAAKIKEKESIIRRIEEETLEPDDKLREKLEKFLNIKLLRKVESSSSGKTGKEETLTIGDIVVVRTK